MRKSVSLLIMLLIYILVFPKWDMKWIDGNQLNMTTTNYGVWGHNVLNGTTGGYWPSGYTTENYIYGCGFWFGALIDTTGNGDFDTLTTAAYSSTSGGSECTPGTGDDSPLFINPYDIVYRSCDENWWWTQTPSHKPDTLVSLLDTWCEYNDLYESAHFSSVNKLIGLIARQSTYSFRGPYMENTIIMRTVIKNVNKEGRDWKEVYIGCNNDLDIGNESGESANDLLGFIDTMTINGIRRQINTGYQFQLEPETSWTHTPGIIGYVILETPPAQQDIDLYHNGSYIIPQGSSIGMTSFFNYTLATFPYSKERRYIALTGHHPVSYDPADPEASYWPFPSWGDNCAAYPGQTQDSIYDPGDKSFLISSGPFDVAYGDSIEFVIAYFIAPTPDEILNYALYIQDFWNNSLNNFITLYTPLPEEEVEGAVLFSWEPYPAKDSFYLELTNLSDSSNTVIRGSNTGNNTVPSASLNDGYYEWYVTNFNHYSTESRSGLRHCIIDNPDANCHPFIKDAAIEIQNDTAYLNWHIIEPEDDSIAANITFVRENGDTMYRISSYADNYSFNAYNNLPNDIYTIIYDAIDDSMAADTYIIENVEYQTVRDELLPVKISGDKDRVKLYMLTYDQDNVTGHRYTLLYDFPFLTYSMNLPFSVYDNTTDTEVLSDTAELLPANFTDGYSIWSGYGTYYSPVFDGLGLYFVYDSLTENCCYDSIKVINDVGYPYAESLLSIESRYPYAFPGRNIDIIWHRNGDTLWIEALPELYNDPITYADTLSYFSLPYEYYFRSYDSPDSLMIYNDDKIDYVLNIAGARIYFKYSGRIYPMDTLMYPDEGEVWRIYSSGDHFPIKGDSYVFSTTGPVNEYGDDAFLSLHLPKSITSDDILFEVRGTGDVDLNLYDLTGRFVANLYTGSIDRYYSTDIDLILKSGVYLIKDKLNDDIKGKIIFIK